MKDKWKEYRYQKPTKETDPARKKHIEEIERLKKIDLICRKEWKRDKTLEKKIRLLEKQLILYDKIMGY